MIKFWGDKSTILKSTPTVAMPILRKSALRNPKKETILAPQKAPAPIDILPAIESTEFHLNASSSSQSNFAARMYLTYVFSIIKYPIYIDDAKQNIPDQYTKYVLLAGV